MCTMCVLVTHSHSIIYHMGEHAAVAVGVHESLFRWREMLLTCLADTCAGECNKFM